MEDLTLLDLVLRSAAAVFCGGVVGWDREKREKAAGLRTMMLVALGAAGLMMGAQELIATSAAGDGLEFDPLRVSSAIAGGIGFLGAGSIIQSRGSVRGLTTAALIWVAASIGIACGVGAFELAGVLTGFVLIVVLVVTGLKGRVLPEREDARNPE